MNGETEGAMKQMRGVETEKAPKAMGPYTQAIVAGEMVFVSAQFPVAPETGLLVADDIRSQTRRVIENLGAILDAAGSSLSLVVKTTVFLTDLGDFSAMNEVYAEYFTGKPARSTIEVSRLPKDSRTGMDCIAVIPDHRD